MSLIKINVITQEGNLEEKEITLNENGDPCGSYILLPELLKNLKVSSLQKMDILRQCLMLSNILQENRWICAQVAPPDFIVEWKEDGCEVFFFVEDERVKKMTPPQTHCQFPMSLDSLPASYFTPNMLHSSSSKKWCSALTNQYAFAQLVLESLRLFSLDLMPTREKLLEDSSFNDVSFSEMAENVIETKIFDTLEQLATDIVNSEVFQKGVELTRDLSAANDFKKRIQWVNAEIQPLIQKEFERRKMATNTDECSSLSNLSLDLEHWSFSPNSKVTEKNNILSVDVTSSNSVLSISPITRASSFSSHYLMNQSIEIDKSSEVKNQNSDLASFLHHSLTVFSDCDENENMDFSSLSQQSYASQRSRATTIAESVKNDSLVSEEIKSVLINVIRGYQNLIKERQKNPISYLFQRHGSAGHARAQQLLNVVNAENTTVGMLNNAINTCFADYEKTSYLKDCGTSKNSLTRHILANTTLVDFLKLNANDNLKKKITEKTTPTFINDSFINDWKGEDQATHSFSFLGKLQNRRYMKAAAGIVKEHLAKAL